MTWSGPAPGCCWRRLSWHAPAAAWRRWSRCSDAAEQAYPGAAEEPFEPTVGRAGSMLVNVPALIAIRRGLLAQLRGDAEATAAFASRALAESQRGRVAAELHRPGIPGRGRVAPWPARGS